MSTQRNLLTLVLIFGLGAVVPLFCGTGDSSAAGKPPAVPPPNMESIATPGFEGLEDLHFNQDYFKGFESLYENLDDYPEFLALAEDDEEVDIVKPDRDPGDREGHEERIGLFRLWRIMNDVNLTDAQVDKFFPLMRKMQQREKELAKARQSLLKGLREELKKEKLSETKLKRLMDLVKENGHLSWEERKNALDQVAQFLTLEQQAKLVLSLNRVEQDIWETVARVRNMPHPPGSINFDRESFRQDMDKVRQNLEKMKLELKEKGYPLPEDNNTGTGTPKDNSGKKKE